MHRSELYKAIAQRLGTVAQGKSTFALFEDGREKLALLDRIMKAVKRDTGGDPARDVNYLAQVISTVKGIRAEVASMVFDDPAWEGDPREAKLAAQFENDKKKWLAKFDAALKELDRLGQGAMKRSKIRNAMMPTDIISQILKQAKDEHLKAKRVAEAKAAQPDRATIGGAAGMAHSMYDSFEFVLRNNLYAMTQSRNAETKKAAKDAYQQIKAMQDWWYAQYLKWSK